MKKIVILLLALWTSVLVGFAQSDVFHGRYVFGDVDYYGDTATSGNAVTITGTNDLPAQLLFRHDDRIAVRVNSKRFKVNDNSISANQAAVRIYLYDSITQAIDSIYHNDLGFRYDDANRNMVIYRKDNGVGTGPFHDTYHEFDIFLEAIYWNRDSDHLDFRRMVGTSGMSEGSIASVNYFRKADYLKIQALDNRHPMEVIKDYLKLFGEGGRQFNIKDFAAYVKYPLSQVYSLMLNLQAEGYLEYDRDTQTVTVLNRFFDVLASQHNEFDFDVIRFQTKVENRQPNVRLMLNTNDMFVYGIYDYQRGSQVPSITLSDYKHVLIIPDNARVVLKKHRDFSFSGCVMAGMYEFFTKDCMFDYSKFTIEMAKVDSLRFYARFDGKVYPVEGTIEHLKGKLEIDEKDNKSSVRTTPDYPKFQSTEMSYKFYRDINGGVFDVDLQWDSVADSIMEGKFYYCLEPFSMNSLDNLNSEDISFKGRLVSGGIFEPITQPLVVMEDHSLGFKHVIGDGKNDSYAMFGGEGSFHHEILLSNEGFYGQGKLDVLTSHYDAQRFDFYLDSVTASVQHFVMQESQGDPALPKASCGPLELKWDLTERQLYTVTQEEPICLYDNTFFRGRTQLSDQGLKGDGELTSGLTRFNSKYFDFDTRTFVADSADFLLYDRDGTTLAFKAENYRSSVNLNSKKVQYEYLDSNSSFDFPLNRFNCSLREAEWDMASNNIHLYNPQQEATKFVSLLPEHDSLSFLCANADYDMNEYVIHAHEVKHINVADALVFPKGNHLDIMRNAKISTLEHAKLLADTANQYHSFKEVTVTIQSRTNYQASGVKDYLAANGVATPVFFDRIAPVKGVTEAHAKVTDSAEFLLSPYFGFQGEITSSASSQFDTYDGMFKLTQSCLEDTVWFASTAVINPDSLYIPINMERIKGKRPGLFNGLCYEFGSGGGYHVNFMKPMNPETMTVLSQDGLLSYDIYKRCYLIEDEKHKDYRLSLSNRCIVTMHGATEMGFDEGLTDFTCYGSFVNYPNDSIEIEVLNTFQVPVFDEQTLKEMADIYRAVEGAGVDLTQTEFLDYLRSEEGEKKTLEMRKDMELTGYPEIEAGSFYDRTIVLPKVKMVWNPKLRAFVSEGKIGIGNLGKNVVNRYVDGYVVFDRRMSVITYYFRNEMFMTYISYNFVEGQMQVHATWGTINSRLADLKEKSRSVKSGGATFEYVVTPYEAMIEFLSRLKRAGLQ